MSFTRVVAVCVGVAAAAGRLSAAATIRELRTQNSTLARHAWQDRLTGILNRASFEEAYITAPDRDRYLVLVDLCRVSGRA